MNIIESVGNLLIPNQFDLICHQTNCNNSFGAGIAAQIKFLYPEAWNLDCGEYAKSPQKLGHVGIVFSKDANAYIANCYAQYLSTFGIVTNRKTNYEAFYICMEKVRNFCYANKNIKSIGFPEKIGCDLGGGNWNIIKTMILETFKETTLDIHIVSWDKTIIYPSNK